MAIRHEVLPDDQQKYVNEIFDNLPSTKAELPYVEQNLDDVIQSGHEGPPSTDDVIQDLQ